MYQKNKPYIIEAKAGDEIYLCRCGKTDKPPFCDGNHKIEKRARPFVFNADKDEQLYVCGCGRSNNLPWCDGTHNK